MSLVEKNEWMDRVDQALEEVRPHLAVDGGNVEVVDISDEMVVRVKWLGACSNCSMSVMTMKAGVEQAIIGRLPEISGVVAV
ncbi:MAG TPA: NifU family protein [Saprospiraceae bacterium]|nr:NifU family protein [Saprospiraceae bacterium]HMQ83284.1 NifU family protein [Saprospiraceae bacterium]